MAITPDMLEAAHWLLAGTTGSGKTYLERGLLEGLRRAGRRVGAIDPRSKLWGLTVSADGKGPGLEFVIFGGKRPGAVPMRPADGDRIGRLFVERNIPAIFDLYGWDEDEQDLWVDAFARAVFATNSTALHLAIDEVQTFVPSRGAQGLAYKALKLLATQGRGDGINLLMTAPRLDGVDVDVRQALGGMVAMLQTSMADRKAVAELVGGHVSIDERALRDQLAELPTGSGFVWSPGTRALERVDFPPNDTFDSSRTPRHGDAPPPPIAISSALVDELRIALAPPVISGTSDADNASAEALRAAHERITELEGQLAGFADLRPQLHRFRRLSAEAFEKLRDLYRTPYVNGEIQELPGAPAVVAEAGEGDPGLGKPSPKSSSGSPAAAISLSGGGRGAAGVDGSATLPTPAANDLPAMTRRLIETLASFYPRSLPIEHVAKIGKVGIKSSQWATHFRAFTESGLVEQLPTNKHWRISEAGARALELKAAPTARKALLAFWTGAFQPAIGRMLDAIVLGPGWIDRDEVLARAGVSPTSSTVGAGLKELLDHGLIERSNEGRFRAAEVWR